MLNQGIESDGKQVTVVKSQKETWDVYSGSRRMFWYCREKQDEVEHSKVRSPEISSTFNVKSFAYFLL